MFAIRFRICLTACLILIAAIAYAETGENTPATPIDVKASQLAAKGIGNNWLSYNGDYTGRRFSRLTQITPKNVSQMRAQWVFHSRNAGVLEVTPLVVNGVMYVTGSNDAYAIDARSGLVLWHHARPVTQGLIDDASGHLNRGVALLGTRLYMQTDNAHLLCLDARSGNLLWDVAYAHNNKNYGATGAPLVVKDKVIVGTSGGDDGVRGFIAAFDAITGKEAWRFWTIPAPGEFGSSSWPGDLYLHGGGTTWMPGTYDPVLNTLYMGTSNPSPDFEGTVRPGDDLYTDCLLALDPDTGKLKWYFQFTPHDLNDFDAVETPILVDMKYHGTQRKLVMQANRNGFIYVLDRTNGKFLSVKQFSQTQNWAKSIDKQGRPIRTDIAPNTAGASVCPGLVGATNWYSPSYSETTARLYFVAVENYCSFYTAKIEKFEEGQEYYSTGVKQLDDERAEKILVAYDPVRNQIVWRVPQVGTIHSYAGVMTTATGLVLFGDPSNSFQAVDAQTGKTLWHFNTGQNIHASPMSYAVDGKQYFAIAAGNDLFTFALP